MFCTRDFQSRGAPSIPPAFYAGCPICLHMYGRLRLSPFCFARNVLFTLRDAFFLLLTIFPFLLFSHFSPLNTLIILSKYLRNKHDRFTLDLRYIDDRLSNPWFNSCLKPLIWQFFLFCILPSELPFLTRLTSLLPQKLQNNKKRRKYLHIWKKSCNFAAWNEKKYKT